MTDTMFTRTALTEAAKGAGVTTDQARTILEAAGVTVEPEKPALPTEPGDAIIATGVRGVKGEWRMFLDSDLDWVSPEKIDEHYWHRPECITAWTEAVVVPVGEARTLTEGTPDWDDVRNAVASERGNGWSLNDAAINGITDAVMRLLNREEA